MECFVGGVSSVLERRNGQSHLCRKKKVVMSNAGCEENSDRRMILGALAGLMVVGVSGPAEATRMSPIDTSLLRICEVIEEEKNSTVFGHLLRLVHMIERAPSCVFLPSPIAHNSVSE